MEIGYKLFIHGLTFIDNDQSKIHLVVKWTKNLIQDRKFVYSSAPAWTQIFLTTISEYYGKTFLRELQKSVRKNVSETIFFCFFQPRRYRQGESRTRKTAKRWYRRIWYSKAEISFRSRLIFTHTHTHTPTSEFWEEKTLKFKLEVC